MVSDEFDRGNERDWNKFLPQNYLDSIGGRPSDNEDLHYSLSIMADYNRVKFDAYIFESACKEMEKRGLKPEEDIRQLHSLMRRRFYDVAGKIHKFYRNNPYRIRLDVREDENHRPKEVEVSDDSFEDQSLEPTYLLPSLQIRKPFEFYVVR